MKTIARFYFAVVIAAACALAIGGVLSWGLGNGYSSLRRDNLSGSMLLGFFVVVALTAFSAIFYKLYGFLSHR